MNRCAITTFGLSHFFNDLCTAGVPALVVLYKNDFHLNYIEATLIVLVSYLTSSVLQPVFGAFADRKPRVWLFSAGLLLSMLGLALTGVATNLSWLLVFIAISGIGSGMYHPEAARGTSLASGGKRGKAQAIFQVGGNAGQAFGPLLIPLFLSRTGIHGLIWFAPVAFLSLFLTGQLLSWLNKEVKAAKTKKKEDSGKNHISGAVLLSLVIVLRSWCQIGVLIFLPFYLKHLSIEASELLNFIFAAAGAIGTLLGGIWSDRLGLKRTMVASMFLATPFALLFPHLHGALMVIDLLLFGFCVLSSFAVAVVYMQKLLPRNIALASGLSIGASVGAGGIGSVLMGGISDAFGVPVVFTILSVLPLIAAVIGCFLPSASKESLAVGARSST